MRIFGALRAIPGCAGDPHAGPVDGLVCSFAGGQGCSRPVAYQSPTETRWEFQQKRGAAIQELLTRFPGDLFVQKIYIRSMYRRADKDKVIAEYKARYEHSPNDPVVAYLYNMALEGRQSAEAIKILETALSKSPQFPWPHLGLASFYGTPVFLNKDEKAKQVKAFLAACPESLDGYQKLTDLDEKDVLAQYAAKLRAMLQTRTDIDAIRSVRNALVD
jgi:predicted Zn-dependent protease